MNKKIKVIDLIDKSYHKNNIPKRIKYVYKIWLYDNVEERYCLEGSFVTLSFETDRLTDEVEILEDNTEEIEELDNWFVDERKECREFDIQAINLCFSKHRDKINELVKAVKKLQKESEDKQ